MNYISIGFLALTGACLFFGFIFGLGRGLGRSIIRLIVVLASVALAFIFREKIADFILGIKIQGKTFEEFIMSMPPEDYQSLSDTIMPIIKLIIIVVAFLVCVLVLQFISQIISGILGSIFVKEKKSKLLGGVVGLVQGALIAVCLCVPLAGLCGNVVKISQIEVEAERLVALPENINCEEAINTGLGKIYYEKGAFLYVKLASTKNADDKEVTLNGQVDALAGAAKMANEFSKITSINLDGGLNADNVSQIKDILANLDEINGELSEETKETITNVIAELADTFDLDVDLSGFDLTTINFTNEGALLDSILDYQEDGEIENVQGLITSIANSDIALAVLDATDVSLSVTDEQKTEVEAALASVSDPEKVAAIRALFGLE